MKKAATIVGLHQRTGCPSDRLEKAGVLPVGKFVSVYK